MDIVGYIEIPGGLGGSGWCFCRGHALIKPWKVPEVEAFLDIIHWKSNDIYKGIRYIMIYI